MDHYSFGDLSLSRLGFGTMRLPLCEDGKTIDEQRVRTMVALAMDAGVNYFDTAYPYHEGQSEIVIGRVLKDYPRSSYYLATKYPGHQIADSYDPAAVFEEQLKKCGVDYFDFYLLHNVCENSMAVYTDPKWGIIDYFTEQKRLGRIRHLGFSSHAAPDALRAFLDRYGDCMEFCQIQLNYLDRTLQDAQAKYDLLTERDIPVFVMEPIRGGRLADLPEDMTQTLRSLRPDESTAAWALRWVAGLDNVAVVLSGMSSEEQMRENLRTFSVSKPLSDGEKDVLYEIAAALGKTVPCTKCRYCTEGCPAGLDIPRLIHAYNDAKFGKNFTVPMMLDSLPADKTPDACLGCGACAAVCPQKIDIPAIMREFAALRPTLPDWGKICRERAEAAKRNKE